MKKVLFALFVVVLVVSLCYAQESEGSSASTSQSAPPVSQAETKSFTGKVNSVSIGNVDEGAKPQITVTDDNGQNLNFVIDSGVMIEDKDRNMLVFTDIKDDSKVVVTYTTDADGINKAQSVKVIE